MLSAIRPIIVWLGTAGKFIGEFCEKVAEAEKQSSCWLNGLAEGENIQKAVRS